MSTMEQVEENIASASQSGPGTLTEAEVALFDKVREKYKELGRIPCTNCQYCLPCPNGVNIPRVFEIYNEARIYSDEEAARGSYAWLDEAQRAHNCVQCADCLDKCPQQIEIPDWLVKAHEQLHREEAR
jgi:predicted aldo/keto reductase-like oxidoreductase